MTSRVTGACGQNPLQVGCTAALALGEGGEAEAGRQNNNAVSPSPLPTIEDGAQDTMRNRSRQPTA